MLIYRVKLYVTIHIFTVECQKGLAASYIMQIAPSGIHQLIMLYANVCTVTLQGPLLLYIFKVNIWDECINYNGLHASHLYECQ